MFRVGRLIRWAVFVGFLSAVGVFQFVRYQPRFTIPELLFVERLSEDGSRLVTVTPPPLGLPYARGPLQVWDTHSGSILHQFFGEAKSAWFTLSPDGGEIAAGLDDGTLRLVDWRTGRERRLDDVDLGFMPVKSPWPQTDWSKPHGRWLFVDPANKNSSYVINVASGAVVLRPPGEFLRFGNDDRLLFARHDKKLDVWDVEIAKKIATLPVESARIDLSPDGKTLVTRRLGPPPGNNVVPPELGIDVWDLATFKLRFHREHRTAGYWEVSFSFDRREVLLGCDTVSSESVDRYDGVTGTYLGKAPFQGRSRDQLIEEVSHPRITTDGCFAVKAVMAGDILRRDQAYFWNRWLAKWWPERFGADASSLVVTESASGQELFRLANAGNQSNWTRLSDDGSTLVTVDAFAPDRRMVRVWDVHPTRAWFWSITVVAASGLVLLAVRYAWRRLRQPPAISTLS